MKTRLKIFVAILAAITAARILVPPQSMFLPQGGASSTIFEAPLKVLHWVSNTPQHASTFAGIPVNVVVDVDNNLTVGSTISIMEDGKEFAVGQTTIDPSGKTMRRIMDTQAPNGKYTVSYRACLTSGGCNEGSFQFAIDRRRAEEFEDHLGRPDIPPDITISIENNSFVPKKLRIRKNTRVIWTNNDTVDHSITTDANYFPEQSSRVLKPKQAHEIVFSEVGEYPYHDSLYPDTMTGSLLVEN